MNNFGSDAVDVAIVGGGIVGLAHAYDAALRGLSVTVLERDERAVGASVRNFGHGFASATSEGAVRDAARRTRERWTRLGREAGIAVREAGTLMVLRHDDEVAAARAYAGGRDDATLLAPQAAAALAPVAIGGVLAALHAPGDLCIDSEHAVELLAAHLQDRHGVDVRWGTAVHAVESGAVHTACGTLSARHVVVCPGPDVQTLFGEVFAARSGLSRTRLQMLEVDPPAGRRYEPALVTGLSLLRYPAFTALPETEAVRARIAATRPELIEHGVHLIVTQRPGGPLIVGDTHAGGATVSPFSREELDELLLAEARLLLGARTLRVRRRWHGVYPTAPGDPFLVAAPLPRVRVVSIVSGIGMTTALGLAPTVLDGMLQAGEADSARPDRRSASTCSEIAKASPR